MTAANKSARRGRHIVDSRSQTSAAWRVVGVLAAIGIADALCVYLVSVSEARAGAGLAESRGLLLAIHAGSFALGAVFLFWTVLVLTHRYTGPAHVIREALAGMRKGEYGRRLTLRQVDYLADLADEVEALREEIAARDVAHARTVNRLERAIAEEDEPVVLDSLRCLGGALPAMPPRRHTG